MASKAMQAAAAARSGLNELKDKVPSDSDRPSLFSAADDAPSLANDSRAVMSEVRLIGGALVAILIVALVLTEVYEAVEVETGPFSGIVDQAETTGVAAITLLIVGLLVLAASVIMRFMGGGFGAR